MEIFRIPKRKLSVEVIPVGGKARQVEVFLADFASDHEGSQRLVDLLNEKSEFFPALDVETQQMSFLGRASLALAWVSATLEGDALEQHTIPTEQEVEVTMSDGTTIMGLVTYLLPPDRSRLIDYLNGSSAFFRLVQYDRVALVHKRHVARVVGF